MASGTIRVFEWVPLIGGAENYAHRTRSVSFGDGYEQTAEDGINTLSKSMAVEFIKDDATIADIKAFLDDHRGYKAFEYDGMLFRASGYTIIRDGAYTKKLSTTFTQAHHA